METSMKLKNTLLGVSASLAIGALALVATTGAASANVVCNNTGDCWHTDSEATYPGTGYNSHPDDWYFHQKWDDNSQYHYRDYHDGRGYYKSGLWITL
jgi:hypothetical protein